MPCGWVQVRVNRVSSFWGSPPYAGYHPLTLVGPPDCSVYGECIAEGEWTNNAAVFPPVGQRIVHASLVATVVATNPAQSTVDIEYAPMYKEDSGSLRQCVIDPAGATKVYPTDCSFVSADYGALRATVPRADLEIFPAGVWCPLTR